MKAEEFKPKYSEREYGKSFLFVIIALLLGILIGNFLSSGDSDVKETILIDGIGGYDKLEICKNETVAKKSMDVYIECRIENCSELKHAVLVYDFDRLDIEEVLKEYGLINTTNYENAMVGAGTIQKRRILLR